jgi:hypothetical protein
VGCGDDESDEPTTTSGATGAAGAISVEQWADAAERICSEGDRAQQQAAEQRFGDQPPSEEELEEFGTAVVVPNLLAQQAAIEALPVPAAEAERIEEMLVALGAGIDAVAADPGALVQGSDSVPAIAEATRLAEEIGLTECGAG